MARLTAKSRNALAPSSFAGPDRSYPIPDRSHALNALARASQHASPELQAKIRRKVRKKFPSIEIEGKACGGRADRAPRGKR